MTVKGKRSPLPIDHSGFTGTKLWLHPGTGLYIVFLSSRLHPDGKGDVFDLREHIITIAVSVAAGQGTPAELSAKAGCRQPSTAEFVTAKKSASRSGPERPGCPAGRGV